MAKFATILICKVNVSVIIRSLFIGCVWGGGGGGGLVAYYVHHREFEIVKHLFNLSSVPLAFFLHP